MHPDSPNDSLQGRSVVVIDDNDVVRKVLVDQLNRMGLRPVEAETAEQGLEILDHTYLAGEPAPLVILDYHLPGASGAELALTLKSRPQFRLSGLILYTGSESLAEAAFLKEIGVAAVLRKPATASQIRSALEQAAVPMRA